MKTQYYLHILPGIYQLFFLMVGVQMPVSAQVHLEATSGITTEMSNDIHIEIDGNWLHQGYLLPGSSTLFFNGTPFQMLQQDGGSFHNITVDKNGNQVVLNGNINVQGGIISLSAGNMELNGHIITLDSLAALNETAGNTIRGALGYVTTTRLLNAPSGINIGGMGLAVNNIGNFGVTEIRRGHTAQSANAAQGIQRYFDFMPTNQLATESTVIFYYDDTELNGNNETDLRMYASPDYGVNWKEVNGELDIMNNSFTALGIEMYTRFTLSSFCLETCIATHASVHPASIYLNASGLAYLPADLINAGSAGACGIDSFMVVPNVFDCDHVGGQDVNLIVTDNNGCTHSAATTVQVLDTMPPVVLCRNISIELDGSCNMTIEPNDIDDGSWDACGLTLSLDVSTFDCSDIGVNIVHLTATDISGNTAIGSATVTITQPLEVICEDATLEMGEAEGIVLHPFDFLAGDQDDYPGFVFSLSPAQVFCNQLGENMITLTATAPNGSVTVCQSTLHVTGPDGDCDGVSDACDMCNGGNDQQDNDNDGIPDCADWNGWQNLPPDWQCAANKVFVCHAGIVICINQNAVAAHLAHGDILGPCNAASCPQLLVVPVAEERVVTQEGEVISNVNTDGARSMIDTALQLQAINYPNPFYPSTQIRFYLPVDGVVSLSVYDAMGNPVEQILNNTISAGWHEKMFDGKHLPSGMYVFRIEAMGRNSTRPMMLLRK